MKRAPKEEVPISRQCRFCKSDTGTVYSEICKVCLPIYRAGQESGEQTLEVTAAEADRHKAALEQILEMGEDSTLGDVLRVFKIADDALNPKR